MYALFLTISSLSAYLGLRYSDTTGTSKTITVTLLDWLPIGISTNNSELHQHLYGLSNGLYIAVIAYLLLAALSYINKNNTRGIARTFLLTSLAFALFVFYGLFFQYYTQAISTRVIPAAWLALAKYATPLALMLSTYIYLKYSAIMSYNAYELGLKYRWVVLCLYAFDIACLPLLFFMQDMQNIATLITLAFVPHALAAAIYTQHAVQSLSLKRFFSFLLLACTLHSLILAYLVTTESLNTSENILVLFSIVFASTALAFSFVAVRYGYDEAELYFHLQDIDHHNLIRGVHKALENDDFYLVYQPQISLKDNQLFGLEALIRWKHPQLGPTLPDDFIPLAEKADLIDGVCRWVIRSSVKECRKLMDQGLSIRISINFSAKNVHPQMIGFLANTLKHHDVPAHNIGIEITESLCLHESKDSQLALDMLHKMGTPLALDDYGTGFSSLSYINQLKLNEIKIDRSFVTDIDSNQDNHVISHSTICLGKTLGLHVIAEGVETEQVLNSLKDMGCDIAQGYYIGHPMPVDQLYPWLDSSAYVSKT